MRSPRDRTLRAIAVVNEAVTASAQRGAADGDDLTQTLPAAHKDTAGWRRPASCRRVNDSDVGARVRRLRGVDQIFLAEERPRQVVRQTLERGGL